MYLFHGKKLDYISAQAMVPPALAGPTTKKSEQWKKNEQWNLDMFLILHKCDCLVKKHSYIDGCM